MMNNSIESLFYELNVEYLDLLKTCCEKIKSNTNPRILVDSVINFWNRKKNKSEHIISCFSNEKCTTLNFTGVSTMDVDSGEAIPFLMSGKRFIYDDPISCRIKLLSDNAVDFEKFKEELLFEIEDEIKIIEQYGRQICVLPISFYYGPKESDVSMIVNKLFLELFDNKYGCIKDFFKNNKNFDDIEKNINSEKARRIVFTNKESETDSLLIKLNKFDFSLLKIEDIGIVQKFYFAVFSVFAQAAVVFLSNLSCCFSPYIRNSVCVTNIINFWPVFFESEHHSIVLESAKKTIASYALYSTIDLPKIVSNNGICVSSKLIGSYLEFYKEIDDVGDIELISLNRYLNIAKEFCLSKNLPFIKNSISL